MSHTSTKAKTTTKVPGPFVVETTFSQIKPAKINLFLFGRWFQLNGGPCGSGVRAHNLGKPNRLGACMIDSKGNVRLEGMFNRARLAPEARRAYDTRGVVVGDVLKRLVKQERPQ